MLSTVDQERIANAVREILVAIGEDPQREGLSKTPERVARAYAELFSEVHGDPSEILDTTFNMDHFEPIVVKDISFHSICEHHLAPFFGNAHIGYLPGARGRVTGLSKLARLVELYARRPQVQERLTTEIAEALMTQLDAAGTFVMLECEHLCMAMRGIRKPGITTITSAARGHFLDPAARADIMTLICG